MRRLVLMACFLAAALAAVVPLTARATLAWPTSVEDLARESSAVVRGRVVSKSAAWAAQGKKIVTLVELETGAVWRGQASSRVTVVVPGGVVDGIGQHVAGAPQFTVGEDVAVFLQGVGPARFRLHGLGMGKFTIGSDEAVPVMTEMQFAAGEVAAGERRVGRMSVAELERRVRSVK
jgi:hypothetical protein